MNIDEKEKPKEMGPALRSLFLKRLSAKSENSFQEAKKSHRVCKTSQALGTGHTLKIRVYQKGRGLVNSALPVRMPKGFVPAMSMKWMRKQKMSKRKQLTIKLEGYGLPWSRSG